MSTPKPPWALLRVRPPERRRRGWLVFENPIEVLEARRPPEVLALLAAAEEATRAGHWAVVFVTYEAAGAFDPALVGHPPGPLPLAWAAVFTQAAERLEPPPTTGPAPELAWAPGLELAPYTRSIDRIHRLIAAGDTYQVNFTWRLEAPFQDDPWPLFYRLQGRRPTDHAAYLDTGRHALVSASPELFFRLERGRITCRPMKGTAPRGRTLAEDRHHALGLYDSPKNRAENLMIVDMIRNDLGRIAEPGTVRVESLFDLERHETVFQLTSTVTAQTAATPAEVLAALFPCASVTGAPKVRTMEIIAALENDPRGAYTGAIGYLAPGGHAEMAVAIRTISIDRETGRARYGTGGGIVWDSAAEDEYRECLAKTRVLSAGLEPGFELLETLLWTAGGGYRLLERHLDRLSASAEYFDFRFTQERVRGELRRFASALVESDATGVVVRLLVGRNGDVRLETRPHHPTERPWRLAVARRAIDPRDRFLFHKTTRREVHDAARREAAGFDDVLLWNPDRELTESAWANLAVRRGGAWHTPPVGAGLLAGCERRERLERGEIQEGVVRLAELPAAEEVALLNSVRGWIEVESVTDLETGREIWRRPRNPDGADP